MRTILSCVALLAAIAPGPLQAQDDAGVEERAVAEAVAAAQGAGCQIVFPSSVLEPELHHPCRDSGRELRDRHARDLQHGRAARLQRLQDDLRDWLRPSGFR